MSALGLLLASSYGVVGTPTGVLRSASADSAGQGRFSIRLVEAPVSHRHDPRAITGIVDHLKPGTTIRRRMEVSTTSRKPLKVEIYPASARIERHRFATDAGRASNELTSWVSIDQPAVRLPAGERRIATVTIRVPKSASAGERYGIVWAQITAAADARHNVAVTNRVGIPLYLDVGPGGEPASDMRIESLTPARAPDGRPQLLAQVHNTGARALNLTGTLSLSDGPVGMRAGPFEVRPGVALAPGETAPVQIVLGKGLPDGPWRARLTLQSGLVRRTASVTLTFPASGTGTSIPLGSRFQYALASLAAAVIAAGGGLFLVRRRRVRP